LYHAQYRSLFRLAVSLTGDADAAEAVVRDSLAALYRLRKRPQTEDDAVPCLRRLLVARSRLARHYLWDGAGPSAALALRTKLCGPKARL
jgi:DNA-directed RNA polymerase specialized sigma24 family protein